MSVLKAIAPVKTKAWQELASHFQAMREVHMATLFQQDSHRFERFSIDFNDILVDFSKNILTDQTLAKLFKLAREVELEEAVTKFFGGCRINYTEDRAAMHMALRHPVNIPFFVDDTDVMPAVQRVRQQMQAFSEKIDTGRLRGFTGKPITTFINIGIGGSDLGPHMVTECLKPFARKGVSVYFVSNIDVAHLMQTLDTADPETTLFVVASKSFTTRETMTNAHSARKWFLSHIGDVKAVKDHFVAVSANRKAVEAFGISPDNMFMFWDWVGGRYSLWSAIGLPIVCSVGYDHFEALLDGAWQMDDHFRKTPLEENIPVILALIGVWYRNFFGTCTEAILPYDQSMHLLPAYLQQVNMESNGKSTDRNGCRVDYATGPILWGGAGTNGQHAFFQLLHQGTVMVPADFLAPAMSHYPAENHHEILLANFFAQTEALLKGRPSPPLGDDTEKDAATPDGMEQRRAPHCRFEGNRPSNTILFPRLTPRVLGMLIAMYEHKIFTQGVIWNIFSFDQWGVELGKVLARTIEAELKHTEPVHTHDGSTRGLINTWKKMVKSAEKQNSEM